MPEQSIPNPFADGLDEVVVRYVREHHQLLIGAATASSLYAVGSRQAAGLTIVEKTATHATILGLDPATGERRQAVVDRSHLNQHVDDLLGALALHDESRAVLAGARTAAVHLAHSYIGTEHVVVAFDELRGSAGAALIAKAGGDLTVARQRLAPFLSLAAAAEGPASPGWTPRSIRAVNLAVNEGTTRGRTALDSDLLALGVIADGEGLGANALAAAGASLEAARRALT